MNCPMCKAIMVDTGQGRYVCYNDACPNNPCPNLRNHARHCEAAAPPRDTAIINLAEVLIGCAGLLDTIKGEWGDSWSKWDQSIRDGITYNLKEIFARGATTQALRQELERIKTATLLEVAEEREEFYGGGEVRSQATKESSK